MPAKAIELSFYARGSALVTEPGRRFIGQPAEYVGRYYVAPDGKGGAASYPATEEPFAVSSADKTGRRLAKVCRRDSTLWAADKETAAHCGVSYVATEFADGEHVELVPPVVATKSVGAKPGRSASK